MIHIHQVGEFSPRAIHARWTESSWRTNAIVDEQIAIAWRNAQARLGDRLFDGPMCRLESHDCIGDTLRLNLSRTSYRIFLGTNLTHPELAENFLANPVGVSAAVISADGFLMLGRRNSSVAYYPNRLHPFAGTLESPDVFADVRRELNEELRLDGGDIADLRCTGLIEDQKLRQPELIFTARAKLSRSEIESRLQKDEHESAWSAPASADGLAGALRREHAFTPVARGTILIFGRLEFGDDWFRES